MTKNDWTTGQKFDNGKARLSLLDRYWLESVAQVMSYGAKKYSAHNWRRGISYSRLIDAAQRHLLAFNDGHDIDQESGLPHLAHASCCLMFLAWMAKERPDMDDRYKIERALQAIEAELRQAIHDPEPLTSDFQDVVKAQGGAA
jgi:hypothetical protein